MHYQIVNARKCVVFGVKHTNSGARCTTSSVPCWEKNRVLKQANTNGWDVLCVYVICCFTAAVTAAIQYAKQMITKCSLKA